MAEVETITISSVDHSVYGLGNADPVQDADDYHGATIGETWSALTTLQKQQALVSAARLLDRAIHFPGTKTSSSQPREWPRDGASNGCTGASITNGTTPDEIAYAEFELAMAIAADTTILTSPGAGDNTKRVKAGSAEVEFFSPTSAADGTATRLPQNVQDIIGCFQDGAGGVLPSSGSLSSGTGDCSSFTPPSSGDCTGNTWNRNRGLS